METIEQIKADYEVERKPLYDAYLATKKLHPEQEDELFNKYVIALRPIIRRRNERTRAIGF